MATQPSWLPCILLEHSTQKYFIEYRRILSNHLAHGVIALARLGATEDRVEQFVVWYSAKLETPDQDGQHVELGEQEDVLVYQGKRTAYYGILHRYEENLKSIGSIDKLISEEFPKVSRGLSGSALHGLIHLGYGYAARNEKIVCEGLAYTNYSHDFMKIDETKPENALSNFGKGDTSILKVLEKLSQNETLRKNMVDGSRAMAKGSWYSGPRMATLLESYGDQMVEYANQIKVPTFEATTPEEKADPMFTVIKISDWVLDQAIALYNMVELNNDFFLIHGVTGAWSLRQVVPLLKLEDALDAIRTLTCTLLTAYMVQNCPALSNPSGLDGPPGDEATWKDIIQKAIAMVTDEHVYKLVQVCHELWLKDPKAPQASMYITAARQVLDNELSFIVYEENPPANQM